VKNKGCGYLSIEIESHFSRSGYGLLIVEIERYKKELNLTSYCFSHHSLPK